MKETTNHKQYITLKELNLPSECPSPWNSQQDKMKNHQHLLEEPHALVCQPYCNIQIIWV